MGLSWECVSWSWVSEVFFTPGYQDGACITKFLSCRAATQAPTSLLPSSDKEGHPDQIPETECSEWTLQQPLGAWYNSRGAAGDGIQYWAFQTGSDSWCPQPPYHSTIPVGPGTAQRDPAATTDPALCWSRWSTPGFVCLNPFEGCWQILYGPWDA